MKTNEHDMTKLMLETLRTKTSIHKAMINENEVMGAEPEVMDSEVESEEETQMDPEHEGWFNEDKQLIIDLTKDKGIKFQDENGNPVFSVDIESGNASIGGILSNGMEFSYSTTCNADVCVQIGTPLGERYVPLTEKTLTTLKMLYVSYDRWRDGWNDRFNES
jgi:hypothetical protein